MTTKIPITLAGFAQLQDEIKNLKTVERPAIIQAIAEAREHGDLSENAEYHAARERQSFIEGRILELEDKASRVDVIDPAKMGGETIKFGATVRVVDEDTEAEYTYQIVGEYESNYEQGKLAFTAPIARALIGKAAGDAVEVSTPKGAKSYEILKVVYE
ncbi:MAG: transcription elongation factor GreA [Alphaproteobacteria bacterium]|nr:transcription elongation factor GreA [Alphaproteobacteria bacterium]